MPLHAIRFQRPVFLNVSTRNVLNIRNYCRNGVFVQWVAKIENRIPGMRVDLCWINCIEPSAEISWDFSPRMDMAALYNSHRSEEGYLGLVWLQDSGALHFVHLEKTKLWRNISTDREYHDLKITGFARLLSILSLLAYATCAVFACACMRLIPCAPCV